MGLYEASLFLYNSFMIPVLFFSLIFYNLAVISLFSKDSIRRFKNKIKNWPTVTIQIPTFNELVALRCANNCLNLDYPEDKFEVIIGDDSNDPSISQKIDEFARLHKGIKVTRRGSNEGFKAGNLNNMLKYSNGEIIVIFDSDFVPSKNFLKKIVQPFIDDENIACVQARWGFINENQNFISKFASGIIMCYQKLIAPLNNRLQVPLLFGSGEAVRKDIITKLGGWQEWSLTEDVEFSVRVLKNGYKIVYLDDLKVNGEVPYTLKDLRKQQKKWAYGNFRAFLDHARAIIFGRFSLKQKSMLLMTLVGYVSSIFLLVFVVSGIISFWSGEPQPLNILNFFRDTSRSIIVSSGFLTALVVVLIKEKKMDMIYSIIVSAFTAGFFVTVSVSVGMLNAIFGKKMNWDMIQKKGNLNLQRSRER